MKKSALLLCVVTFSISVFSQRVDHKTFSFTQIVNNDKWKQMTVYDRIIALQIPESEIHSISTSELLDICLDFPYLIDILFSNDLQLGFEELTVEFNGFRELLLRENLPEVVFEKNKGLVNEISKLNDNHFDKGLFSIKWLVFEMLITQESVLSGMSNETRALFLSSCKENMNIKSNYPTIFSNVNTIPSCLLFAKQIVIDDSFKQYGKEDKDLIIGFVERPVGIPESVLPLIIEFIQSNY